MLQSLLYSRDFKKKSIELNWDEFLNYAEACFLTMASSYFAHATLLDSHLV